MAAKRSARKQGETIPATTKKAAAKKPDEKKADAKKPKGRDDKDRAVMDAASQVKPGPAKGYMHDQADLDRGDARSTKLNKALTKVKDDCASMSKAIAHAQATDHDDMKVACLDEIATLGNSIRDAARKAIRDAKQPAPNVQK